MQIGVLNAKTELPKSIKVSEQEKDRTSVSKRIGSAKGKLKSPDDIDQNNNQITRLFGSTGGKG